MDKKLILVSGTVADGSEFDDSGRATYRVEGGNHDGHTVTIDTAKYNCGVYAVDIICSCGKSWQNGMSGCWQYGHQRRENGDPEIGAMETLEYQTVSA